MAHDLWRQKPGGLHRNYSEMKPKNLAEYRPIIQRYPYVRSRKLLDSSRGQVCTLNFHGCDYGTETTVACHGNGDFLGKGTGIKASDIYSVDGCNSCHSILDGRTPSEYTEEQKWWFFWRALVKTTNRRIAEGIIKVEGA